MPNPTAETVGAAMPALRTRRLARGVLTMVAAAGLLVAAGCSSGIDVGQLEGDIANQLAERVGVQPDTVKVVCPSEIPVAEGETTDCSATAAGTTYVVRLVQLDGDGTMEWETIEADDK